jgi:hypothetical protein
MKKQDDEMDEQEETAEPVRPQGERRTFEGGVFLPKSLVYAGENLTHGEFRLMAILLSFSGKRPDGNYQGCWPGREGLALRMGISETQVSNLLCRLKKKGLLVIKPRGQGKTNIYYPKAPPISWKEDVDKNIFVAKMKKKEKLEREYREGTDVLR